MIYQGNSLSAQLLEDGIIELKFDAQGSVNKFDQVTLEEFVSAIAAINACSEAKGVVVTSAKSTFLVGADITEFLGTFKQSEDVLTSWIKNASDIFDSFEDIKVPTIAAVNGVALGGGWAGNLKNAGFKGEFTYKNGFKANYIQNKPVVIQPSGSGISESKIFIAAKEVKVIDGYAEPEEINKFDGIIVRNKTNLDGSILEKAVNLKYIGRLGVGLDNIDTEYCNKNNIFVQPATGMDADSVAEYVVNSSLILLKKTSLKISSIIPCERAGSLF